jgi:hypothetical protein
MAKHQDRWSCPALYEGLPQQTPALFVAQMKIRMGIRIRPQKFWIMVGLHIDKVRIGKPAGKPSPIPKVSSDHNLSLPALSVDAYGKPKSRADSIVGQAKGVDGEVADREGLLGKRANFEIQKRRLAEMSARQRFDIPFVKINRDPAFFQEAKGSILDVVAVQVRNDYPIYCG